MTITISPPSSSKSSAGSEYLTPASPKHSSPLAGGKPVPIPQQARRASSSTSTPSPRSFLVGSYPLSLLQSRLGPSSPPSSFTLRIRAIAPSSSPQPLSLPFKAANYDHEGPGSSPWVGDVDIENHYFANMPPESAYPGYRVPQAGQLQLVISGPQGPVHAFIVPYDLTSVPVNGRMLARERTYGATRLRYAVQLQFVCCPGDESESTEHYLARELKLVFTASRGEEELHSEREDEIVHPAPLSSFSPRHRRRSSFEASAEWSRMRAAQVPRKAKAEARGFVSKPRSERPRSPVPPAKGASLLSALAPGRGEGGGEGGGEGRPGGREREREKQDKVRPGLGRTDTDTELSARLRGLDLDDVV